jgi:TolB protein
MAKKIVDYNQINNKPKRSRLSLVSWLLLILINLVILAFLGWNAWMAGVLNSYLPAQYQIQPTRLEQAPSPSPTEPEPPTPTIEATIPPTPTATAILPAASGTTSFPGLIVVAMAEAGYSHLFAYHPENLPLTRLTYGEWDDVQPTLSPDGSQVAFVSHRGGQWDIFVLDLASGALIQVTYDRAYDGHPAWSPDGLWLAYEKYIDDNLDIYMQPVDGSIAETRVTYYGAADFEPAWHPGGTRIAFTSTRTGAHDIMIADLEKLGTEEAITNFTYNATVNQRHPVWSPDGSQLAYTALHDGYPGIYLTDYAQGPASARYINAGTQIAWAPGGAHLLVLQVAVDSTFLAILDAAGKTYQLPPFMLSGRIAQISWGPDSLPETLPADIQTAAQVDAGAGWQLQLTPDAGTLYGRQNVIEIPDLNAPYPAFSPMAVEPFYALKDRTAAELGWDLLSDLENAFIPISTALPPGHSQDWLYTGRAFALNSVLIDADWILVTREDFGSQTYWRVFVKTRFQDGSQGRPLTDFPWDFSARWTGNTTAYEEGGTQLSVIPSGYWLDFTALAGDYGWERFPALYNWRSYYQGTRFNVFAITSGLDWEDAMLQLWPLESFDTQP